MSDGRYGVRVEGNIVHLIFVAADAEMAEQFAATLTQQLEKLVDDDEDDVEDEPPMDPSTVADLKIGDRVLVVIGYGRWQREKRFTGKIIGEARDGHSWQIVKDGTKYPRGIHKSFCQPAE